MSLPNAITREDFYLNKIANPSDDHELPDAITRTQHYLKAIAENAGTVGDGLNVNITLSEGTYTADQTYADIRAAIENGRMVYLKYDGRYYNMIALSDNGIAFDMPLSISNTQPAVVDGKIYAGITFIDNRRFTIKPDNTITNVAVTYYINRYISVTDGTAITAPEYAMMKAFPFIFWLINDNEYYILAKANAASTEFDFVNALNGKKVHIGTDRVATITTI